ncbi:MAG: hypothetical protein ACOCR0_01520 [Haloferacaceae archaeon]
MSDAATGDGDVRCPNCGAEVEPAESGTFTDPEELSVDKIVFDGVARWVEFEDRIEYQMYRCPECQRRVRQVEWDGEIEPPVLVPEVDEDRH